MSKPPAPAWREDSSGLTYAQLLERSIEALHTKTAAHDALWHIGEAAWAVDQDAGTITFTRADGISAVCPVQIVGTYNTLDGTWLWGWDHPSVAPALQAHAHAVYAYGTNAGIARLTTRKLTCSEEEAWEFAALACELCDAQGAYRGPSGTVLVFMTFGEVTLRGADTPTLDRLPSATAAGRAAPDQVRKDEPSAGGVKEMSAERPAALQDPALLVESFIADYAAWNNAAFLRSERGEDSSWAQAAYAELLARYCSPNVVTQPLAFGSDPMHDSAHEAIVSVMTEGTTAVVGTRHVDPSVGFASDYAYHCRWDGTRWFLERLLYLDADGAYDCL